jgi:hypothetical protein
MDKKENPSETKRNADVLAKILIDRKGVLENHAWNRELSECEQEELSSIDGHLQWYFSKNWEDYEKPDFSLKNKI